MKLSKVIALSALCTAMSATLLCIGAYFLSLSYSCIFLASVVVLLPLAKETYKGAILTVIASALLSFLIASFSFETDLPYLLFFGFHPIVSKYLEEKKLNRFLAYLIKNLWFVGSMLCCYFLTSMFIVENETLKKYMIYIIIIGGSIFFVIYDVLFKFFQKQMNVISKRLKI